MVEKDRDTAGILAPPPLIYALPLGLGLLLHALYPVGFLPWTALRHLGWPLIGIGIAFVLGAVWAMVRAHTTPDPHHPTTAVVVEGPFRHSRNPIYLGFTAIYLGVTFLVNSLWALLLLPAAVAVMRWGVIAREEQYLERKFGETYLRYKAAVRRWI